jgi:hypothetical protein
MGRSGGEPDGGSDEGADGDGGSDGEPDGEPEEEPDEEPDGRMLRKPAGRSLGAISLSTRPANPTVMPHPKAQTPPLNEASHVHCSIMKMFLASAADAELGGLF